MERAEPNEWVTEWVVVCAMSDLAEQAGVAALLPHQRQAAVFLVDGMLYAVSNIDPFGRAAVLARGIVGDVDGVPVVTSPLHKHRFDLRSGRCLDDEETHLATYPVNVTDGVVHLGMFDR